MSLDLLLILMGSALGALGAGLGMALSRGRARRFVLGCLWSMTAVGLAGLLLGGLAWLTGQPRPVAFALLLLGGLCLGSGAGLLALARRRYAVRPGDGVR
jgi:hypothetical protein